MWENDSPESPITLRDPMVPGVAPQPPRGGHKERSVIGSTLSIKGEVSGGDGLLIEGRIEGRLSLTGCNITVGREGRIKVDLLAKTIQVDGCVEGTLQGEEWIRLSETGRIRGKLIAPRVILNRGLQLQRHRRHGRQRHVFPLNNRFHIRAEDLSVRRTDRARRRTVPALIPSHNGRKSD